MRGEGGTLGRNCSARLSEHPVFVWIQPLFLEPGWLILGTPFFRNPSACDVARISVTNILSFALETICCFSPEWSFVICCLRYHGKISKWWCNLRGENTKLIFLLVENWLFLSMNKIYKIFLKKPSKTLVHLFFSHVTGAIQLEVSHLFFFLQGMFGVLTVHAHFAPSSLTDFTYSEHSFCLEACFNLISFFFPSRDRVHSLH